ncbi:7510_t:CDS:2 [Funneliformis mosseae]|uniref:7510_t:CDS:1 n=1 Tax=Funneliformis mosseae TaxID=27381 RepID=A0A9N8ZQJ3_FUNMO|nr:7510_t:CDS:2 [Funneliformis mosseae]
METVISQEIDPNMIVLSKTESIVISSNKKHVVTQHAEDSLAIWDVDIDTKTIKFVNKINSRGKILELSNDKLLIFGDGYDRFIGTIEPHEEIEIHKNSHNFIYASFLPNGDLLTIDGQDIYVYVNSKETLKKSKTTCSYKLTCYVTMIKPNHGDDGVKYKSRHEEATNQVILIGEKEAKEGCQSEAPITSLLSEKSDDIV